MSGPPTLFRALFREAPRLPVRTRAWSLGAAVAASAVLVAAVFVAWSLWVGLLRGREGPIPVWIGPEEQAGGP